FGTRLKRFPFELDAGRFQDADGSLSDFGPDAVARDESNAMSHNLAFSSRAVLVEVLGLSRRLTASLGRVLGLEEVFEFRHELVHVLEIQVYRGKPHVSHFVVAAQAIHDEFAHFTGFSFTLGRFYDEGLGFVHNLFELADGNGPLLTGAQ